MGLADEEGLEKELKGSHQKVGGEHTFSDTRQETVLKLQVVNNHRDPAGKSREWDEIVDIGY